MNAVKNDTSQNMGRLSSSVRVLSLSLSPTPITLVVLCGGSGTRLWPLSRRLFPKQFVPLIGNKNLLQLTLERVSLLSKSVICVASDECRILVAEALGMQLRWEGEGVNEVGYADNKAVIRIDPRYFRPTEVETLLGDPSKAKQKLGWVPEITTQEMCREMVANDLVQAKQHGYSVNVSSRVKHAPL